MIVDRCVEREVGIVVKDFSICEAFAGAELQGLTLLCLDWSEVADVVTVLQMWSLSTSSSIEAFSVSFSILHTVLCRLRVMVVPLSELLRGVALLFSAG